MAKRKLGGLGKGLDSLFEDLPMTEDASPDLTRLPVREIEPDPDQPRKNFDEDAMAALAESIGENGLLQPIAVRAKKTGPGYVIIAGERRWRAARMAGLDEVPVLIKEVTDEQAAALALIENLQREDLDPIEVAEGCKKLIERYGLTQEEAAKRLGKSRSAITNAMRLLNLPEYVRDQVRTGDISAGHAKALLSLSSPEQMSAAADQIIAKDMSVRQAEEAVALWREEQRLPWTAASEAAGYCQAKPCRSCSVKTGSAAGASGAGASSAAGWSSSGASSKEKSMVLRVSANGSSRFSARRRSGPPLGWTSRAVRSQSAKLLACRFSVSPAPAARKAAAFASGLVVLVMPSGMVRINLSCARVSATYSRRICSLRSSAAWTLASAA